MKRITLILDGSADRPNAALMNKTPLAAANTPNLDALAQKATKLLRVKTIPDGLEVGSAVANMGLLGLDPHMYRGRAALEAAGSGIPLDPNNLYIRTNLATLTGDSYDTAVLSDYSAGELPTDKAAPIVELLREGIQLSRICAASSGILPLHTGSEGRGEAIPHAACPGARHNWPQSGGLQRRRKGKAVYGASAQGV